MSVALATALGVVAAEAAVAARRGRPGWVGAAVATLVWQPIATVVGGMGVAALWARRRLARRREADRIAAAEVLLLAELLGLAIGAGMGMHAAVAAARDELESALRREVTAVLAAARRDGLALALAAADGHAGELFRLLARAVATGAPMGPALAAFTAERGRQLRAEELARARRLPIRLLLPLALLILPGFVVLTLGPAVLGGLDRLQFALPPVAGRMPAR